MDLRTESVPPGRGTERRNDMGVPLLAIVVVLTFAYLFYALLRPEKF